MMAPAPGDYTVQATATDEDEDDGDPRTELIRRLQEYERYKQAAEDIDELPRLNRDLYVASAEPPDFESTKPSQWN